MQSAALFGLYALNVVAVAIFAAPAALSPASGDRPRHAAIPVLALLSVAALGAYGVLRLSQTPTTFVPDLTIRIAQPNLSQLQKWDPAKKDEVLSSYFRLSAPEGAPLEEGMLLVWPESAFPFPLTQSPGTLAAIAELMPRGAALVTGAYREEFSQNGPKTAYNSIHVIGDDGIIISSYDKVHMVPFGEYLPAGELLAPYGIRQIVPIRGFSPGPVRRALTAPLGPPFLPLICYEIIFSGRVLGEGPRPAFMLNVTNDGWFGRTTGPYQHFHQARVRSVEEGLPLVRAANTGISAIIDAYGRSLAQTQLGEATMIEARLPASIEPPFYAQWREIIFILSMAVCILVAATKILYRASSV
jgi:apolipoprotein N-acyltransferase